jgi:hypothetical protein
MIIIGTLITPLNYRANAETLSRAGHRLWSWQKPGEEGEV